MQTELKKPRLLVFVVAYNAERTIESVLARIPESLMEDFETEVLVIDDSSKDATFQRACYVEKTGMFAFPLTVLFNPQNQGYGGNQKLGYHYAIAQNFDFVAMIHGDGQYAPELLPEMMEQFDSENIGAVFGSRMLRKKDALKGGMPLYKFYGNQILTWMQNRMLGSSLSEFHSGYRVYAVPALRSIPFHLNSNAFHFDTEIIIQMLLSPFQIRETPIPTFYGDEVCHVNGVRYAFDIMVQTLVSKLQHFHVFYDPKYDVGPKKLRDVRRFQETRMRSITPEHFLLRQLAGESCVNIVGSNGEVLSENLASQGVKIKTWPDHQVFEQFLQSEELLTPGPVVMADGLEPYADGLTMLVNLKQKMDKSAVCKLYVVSGNLGFWMIRVRLLLGAFNYSRRGILNTDALKVYTLATLKRTIRRSGMSKLKCRGFPVPVELILGHGFIATFLTKMGWFLARLWGALFSYQILVECEPNRSLDSLLADAFVASGESNASD